MKKKKIIIVIVFAFVIVAALSLIHIPTRIQDSITVSTYTGETAKFEIDIQYYKSLILPSYIKGTITVDGVVYTDKYTISKGFRGLSDNRLFPSDWWKRKGSGPYNTTFVRSDCTDIISATHNRIEFFNIVLNKGVSKIHYAYLDDSNMVDSHIEGIMFCGPAQNAEEAKQIAESFGYKVPQ